MDGISPSAGSTAGALEELTETGGEIGREIEAATPDLPTTRSTRSSRASAPSATRGDSPETRLRLMAENLEMIFRQLDGQARGVREQSATFGQVVDELRAHMGLMRRQIGDHDAVLERLRIAISAQVEVERRLRELLVHVERTRDG